KNLGLAMWPRAATEASAIQAAVWQPEMDESGTRTGVDHNQRASEARSRDERFRREEARLVAAGSGVERAGHRTQPSLLVRARRVSDAVRPSGRGLRLPGARGCGGDVGATEPSLVVGWRSG